MKRIAITLLAILGFSIMISSTAMASSGQFSVTKYLKASDEHKMSYFDQGEGSTISPIAEVILRVIDIMVLVIGSLAGLALIVGGIMFITGAGNEQSLQRGKDIFKYSLAGLAVAFLSFAMVTFVESILK